MVGAVISFIYRWWNWDSGEGTWQSHKVGKLEPRAWNPDALPSFFSPVSCLCHPATTHVPLSHGRCHATPCFPYWVHRWSMQPTISKRLRVGWDISCILASGIFVFRGQIQGCGSFFFLFLPKSGASHWHSSAFFLRGSEPGLCMHSTGGQAIFSFCLTFGFGAQRDLFSTLSLSSALCHRYESSVSVFWA